MLKKKIFIAQLMIFALSNLVYFLIVAELLCRISIVVIQGANIWQVSRSSIPFNYLLITDIIF